MWHHNRLRSPVAGFLGVFFSTPIAGAGTITVQPGSCVNVSGQEICSASQTDGASGKLEVTYSCRYGTHKSGDLPGYKTYALIKVITDASGKSTEVFVKDFGMKGKAKCEQAVEDRTK